LGSVPQNCGFSGQEEFPFFGTFPFPDATDQIFVDDPIDLNVVYLFQMRFRIEDSRGPAVIVGEKQETFAGLVEPPHCGKPGKFLTLEAVVNGLSSFFVGRGYDQPARFVEHDIDFGRRGDGPAIHFEAIPVQIYPPFRIPGYDSIKPDLPIPDQGKAFCAGAEAYLGKSPR